MTSDEKTVLFACLISLALFPVAYPVTVYRIRKKGMQSLMPPGFLNNSASLEYRKRRISQSVQTLRSVYSWARFILPLYTVLAGVMLFEFISGDKHGIRIYFVIISGTMSAALFIIIKILMALQKLAGQQLSEPSDSKGK